MNNADFQRAKADFLRRQTGGENKPGILIIGAIIFIIVGVLMNNGTITFMDSAKATKGVLHYERNFSKDTKDTRYYDVYASYTVDGKEYRSLLRGEAVDDNFGVVTGEGKEVTIYYNPENPAVIRDNTSNARGKIVLTVGVVVLLLAIGDIIYCVAKGRRVGDTTANDEAAVKFANHVEDFFNKTGIIDDDKNGKI